MSLLLWRPRAGTGGPAPPALTVAERTPDLLTLITWRPEQFDRVSNSGFEATTTGWAGDSGGSIARVTTDGHSGSACLSVTATEAGDGAVHAIAGNFYSEAYGARYIATFWARRFSGARRWAMELGDSGGDVATVEMPDLSDAWRQFKVAWRPSATRTSVRLRPYVLDDAAGVMHLDDVYVWLDASTQIENGDFEVDTEGWTSATSGAIARSSGGFGGDWHGRVTAIASSGSGVRFAMGSQVWLAGRTYRFRYAARTISGEDEIVFRFGDIASADYAEQLPALTAEWGVYTLDWTPSADRLTARVESVTPNDTASVWDIDELEVYEALDEVTPRAVDITIGAMSGGDEQPIGTITMEVADIAAVFSPRNAASPLAGSVDAGKPVHLRAIHDERMHGVGWGRLTRITPDPYSKVASFAADDGLGVLAAADIERPFRTDIAFVDARAEALIAAGLSTRQIIGLGYGAESGTFVDGTDGEVTCLGYLQDLDEATGSIAAAVPSPHAMVGWAYESIDRSEALDDIHDGTAVIVDDSRGPLAGIETSHDTLVSRATVAWQAYEPLPPPVASDGTNVELPWGDEAHPLGYGVVVIGGDEAVYPTLLPYLVHTRDLYGSGEAPEQEEVWTISRVRRTHWQRRRKHGKSIWRARRSLTLVWPDPIFPITIPAGESHLLPIEFTIPMEGIEASLSATNSPTVTLAIEPSRVDVTIQAGDLDVQVDGLAIIARPWRPLPEAVAVVDSASVADHRSVEGDDTYVNGLAQAEGLAEYHVWRHESARLRPVVQDGLRPDRQLALGIADHVTLTVGKYDLAGIETIIRGKRHRIARPAPWYTDYALEELPAGRHWVRINSARGINTNAVVAY